MANDSSTFDLPAPMTVLSGMKLVSEEDSVKAAGLINNWLLARGGAGTPLLDQGWDGAAFTWAGAAQVGPTWRIPTVSGAHLTVDVTVNFTKTVGAGLLRVLSAVAGGAVAVAAPVGGPGEVTLTGLAVAPGFDDVSLEVTSAAGQITIHDVFVSTPYLADPLPAAAVDGATPMGIDSLDADAPHTARINKNWLTNLPILRQRPRVVACWSGLDPAVGQESLRTGMSYRVLTRTWQGSVAKGVTYQAHARVRNLTAGAQRLAWQAGPLGLATGDHLVTVGAGFDGWKITTIVLPDQVQVPGYPWEATSVGLDLVPGSGYETTCEVLAYTVWGE